MSLLDGFKVFNFNEGVPYVSLTRNGVTFNKAVVMKLGYPQHVLLMIDNETRRIAIKVCDEKEANAAEFYKPKKANVLSVRWNGRDLLNTLSSMMNWNLEKESYRVEGELIQEENAMLFDFNKATVLN